MHVQMVPFQVINEHMEDFLNFYTAYLDQARFPYKFTGKIGTVFEIISQYIQTQGNILKRNIIFTKI